MVVLMVAAVSACTGSAHPGRPMAQAEPVTAASFAPRGPSDPALASTSEASADRATSPATSAAGALRIVDVLPARVEPGAGADLVIAPGDVIDVSVFQVGDLARTVQVDARGQISLPLIGTVAAAGKSLRGLEGEIKAMYGARYLQNPDVGLFMKESAGQRVTVDGEVARAGLYPVTAGSTLQQVLAQAGGLRPIADPSKVFVFRTVGEERLVAGYSVADIRAGRGLDPVVYGGDTVVVFSSAARAALENLKEALGIARGVALVGL